MLLDEGVGYILVVFTGIAVSMVEPASLVGGVPEHSGVVGSGWSRRGDRKTPTATGRGIGPCVGSTRESTEVIERMDYSKSSPRFRVRKLWRYLCMYGPSRTACKVRGQFHHRARYDPLPTRRRVPEAAGHVGIIGCGNYAFTTIAYYLRKEKGRVLRGVMDIDPHRAASLFERYGAAYHTTDATGNPI